MAIVKMKKLRVTAMRSQKEELLKKLLILGCVEVSEPDGLLADPEVAALTVRETGELDVLRSEQASVARALETLGRYAPAKSKMFAEREDVAASDFLEEAEIGENIRLAVRIEEIDSQIRYTNAEETRLAAQIESLLPWEPLELALDHEGTRTSAVLLGSVPPSTDFPALERALEDAAAEARAYKISVGRDQLCLCVIYLREKQDEVSDALREFSFSTSAPKNVQGTARENLEELRRRVSEQREQRAELTEEINAASPLRAGLVRCADVLTTKISRAEAGERFIATASTFTFTGWLPAPSEDELVKALGSFVCEWELMEPDPEEYPDVPVKLENNAVTSPLMMVTEMYSLPSYDGIDPNPLMAPFFIPFYGFMMADMGYGILMVVAALLIRRKKPRGGMKNFIDLLLMCGVTTIGGGFLTAGFFGDAPTQIAALFGKTFALPWTPLLDPLNQPIQVLIFAFALGFIQIIAGMAINLYMAVRDGHALDGILDNVPWWITFAGVAVLVLGKMGKLGASFAGTLAFVPMIIGFVLVAATQGRSKPTVGGKIVSGLGSLYNITAYFSDVLSYARVMALMLAGGVIANVFNMIGAMTGPIFFWPIFLIGHALNIALNLLGNYVHDLRLQCLEYFGKFYKDGGKAFRPLEVRSKHYNIVK